MSEQLLVAGGGIGGLAAALAATHAGWDVRLYERTPVFSEVGAGIQLGPNSVRCLQAWGLQKPFQAVAAFPDASQIFERNIETLQKLGLAGWMALGFSQPKA